MKISYVKIVGCTWLLSLFFSLSFLYAEGSGFQGAWASGLWTWQWFSVAPSLGGREWLE